MKKLTKAQIAEFPKYLVEIDTTARGEELGYGRLTVKGTSKELLDVIASVDKKREEIEEENFITGKSPVIYLVSLYFQVGSIETGEPLYARKLMSRTIGEWHLADESHHENKEGNLYTYWKSGEKEGSEFHSKK